MIKFDKSGLKLSLETTKEKFQKAVRPAAQAGAQIIYEAALRNVPVGKEGKFFYSTSYKSTKNKYYKYYYPAGALRDSIYQVYSKDNSSEGKATYHISWSAEGAPYAWMVEFGTSKMRARPFLAPAIAESRDAAARAIKQRFLQEVGR